MPNPEHLEILKQGVEAWNKWRKEKRISRKKYLGSFGYKPHGFHYRDLELSLAEQSIIDLSGAILTNADLSFVDFEDVHLAYATLRGACLHGANLRLATLRGAVMKSVNLSDADLSYAIIDETIFADCDMRGTKGLKTCSHRGPSTIDHRTLRKSWPLPLVFLRGCGLPETYIEYFPYLIDKPFEFYSCFISYSSQDEEFVGRLHADLQDNGVRCWFAPEDLKIGDMIRPTIDNAIRIRDKLLLVLSKISIESEWVEKEVETAFEEEKRRKVTVLFPIRLDDVVMETKKAWAADIRRTRHIGDFRTWRDHDPYTKALKRLLRDLKALDDKHGV